MTMCTFILITYLPICNITTTLYFNNEKTKGNKSKKMHSFSWHKLTYTFTFNLCSKIERGRKPGHVNSQRLGVYVVLHLFIMHTCTIR